MHIIHKLVAIALWCSAAMLSACGGGDGSSVVSGTVRDHQQAAVAHAEVLAVDRLSGREFNTLSDENGRYRMVLPNGHYDLGADDAHRRAAHMVMLRSLSDSDTTVDFVVPSDQDAAQLSGQVFVRPGVPAANHRLVFSSDHHVSDEDPSLRMETTTNAQGEFTVALGAQRLLDLDVHDEQGDFIEFVVLHKLDGALRADITLGDSSDDNRYRHDRGAEAVSAAAVRQASASGNQAFSVDWREISDTQWVYTLGGGQLPVDGSYLRIDPDSPVTVLDALGRPAREVPLVDGLQEALGETLLLRSFTPPVLDVSARQDGKLWYHYAVHFSVYEDSDPTVFRFTDASGDVYEKSVSSGYYKLSYDSDAPSMLSIEGWVSAPTPYRSVFRSND
jgi:hypothetical protein